MRHSRVIMLATLAALLGCQGAPGFGTASQMDSVTGRLPGGIGTGSVPSVGIGPKAGLWELTAVSSNQTNWKGYMQLDPVASTGAVTGRIHWISDQGHKAKSTISGSFDPQSRRLVFDEHTGEGNYTGDFRYDITLGDSGDRIMAGSWTMPTESPETKGTLDGFWRGTEALTAETFPAAPAAGTLPGGPGHPPTAAPPTAGMPPAGPGPTAPDSGPAGSEAGSATLTLLGTTADRMGTHSLGPSGKNDGHFQLQLNRPGPVAITSIILKTVDDAGNPAHSQVWNTAPGPYWVLGVFQDEASSASVAKPFLDSLGTLDGSKPIDLYAEDSGFFAGGARFKVEVTLADGSIVTAFAPPLGTPVPPTAPVAPTAPAPPPVTPGISGAGACLDPRVQAIMDEWLLLAKPIQQPGDTLRYEAWGRVIGRTKTTTLSTPVGKPDTHLSRCEYLWQARYQLWSTDLGYLGDYINTKLAGGG